MNSRELTNKVAAKTNKATRNYAAILQSIIAEGNTSLGEQMGRDAAFITRIKADETRICLSEFVQLVSLCHLELNQEEDDTIKVKRSIVDAMRYLSVAGLERETANVDDEVELVTITNELYKAIKCFAFIGMRSIEQDGKAL